MLAALSLLAPASNGGHKNKALQPEGSHKVNHKATKLKQKFPLSCDGLIDARGLGSPMTCDALDTDECTAHYVNYNSRDLHGRTCSIIGGRCASGAACMLSRPASVCPPGCVEDSTPSVHGDPMFKVNGTGTHFYVKEGKLIPMLKWTCPKTKEELKLMARTFGSEDPQAHRQWFGEFAVRRAGKTVLQVTIDNGVMSVVRDGNTKATQVQDDMETTLGGLTMRIFAEKSKKFVSPIDRIKYAHLNIDFAHHFPADARGVFAELGGIQPMSQATSQLLRPHGHHDKPSSAISLLSPRKKEAVCICPPPPPAPPALPPYVPVCEQTSTDFKFEGMELVYNNLGGLGPNKKDPREIRFKSVISNFPDPDDASKNATFHFVITNESEYFSQRTWLNGVFGVLANVNIGKGITRMRFRLVDDLDNNPLRIPIETPLFSFFDFDHTDKFHSLRDKTCGEVMQYPGKNIVGSYGITTDDMFVYRAPDNTTTVSALHWGDGHDNVKDPAKLTHHQLNKSFAVVAKSTDFSFDVGIVKLKKSHDGSMKTNGCGKKRRNLMIGGFSAAKINCAPGDFSTKSGEEGSMLKRSADFVRKHMMEQLSSHAEAVARQKPEKQSSGPREEEDDEPDDEDAQMSWDEFRASKMAKNPKLTQKEIDQQYRQYVVYFEDN